MDISTVTVTRRTLYEEAWQTPMSTLARKYGLSDVGLAKTFRKHRIPRPTRGHWMKKGAGKRIRQIPLPSPGENPPIEIRSHAVGTQIKDEAVRAEARRLTEREKLPAVAITVPENLRRSNPLIREAHRRLRIADRDLAGRLRPPDVRSLSIEVSRKQLRRALLIMDTLIKALMGRRYDVTFGPQGNAPVGAVIMAEHVSFGLEEIVDVTEKEPTAQQLEDKRKYGRYWPQMIHAPSGRLCFEIRDSKYHYDGLRRRWRDTQTRCIEDCLNDIMRGLILVAARLRDDTIERKRREQKAAEERRLREERRLAYEQELARFTKLKSDAAEWGRAREIREYIEAARRDAVAADGGVKPERAAWIEWALNQADRIDPLKKSPPSILDEPCPEMPWHLRQT